MPRSSSVTSPPLSPLSSQLPSSLLETRRPCCPWLSGLVSSVLPPPSTRSSCIEETPASAKKSESSRPGSVIMAAQHPNPPNRRRLRTTWHLLMNANNLVNELKQSKFGPVRQIVLWSERICRSLPMNPKERHERVNWADVESTLLRLLGRATCSPTYTSKTWGTGGLTPLRIGALPSF